MNEKSNDSTVEHSDSCGGCGNWERRQFVQSAVGSVAALLGLALFRSSEAAAQIYAIHSPASGARGMTTYAVPSPDSVSIDTSNDVIIARAGDKAYAFALSCPHQNTALRWNARDHRFQCPKHKSKYTPAGEFIDGRATRNMDRLAIKLEGTSLVVDTSREIRSDTEAAKWAAAFVHVAA